MDLKKLSIAILVICSAMTLSCTNGGKATSDNPSQYLTDSEKIEMVHSLKTLDGERLLEMDYTLDYDLDGLIEYDAFSYEKLIEFMCTKLLDVVPDHSMAIGTASGCSAFAATDPASSDKYFGRNYDFCHVEDGVEVPITAIMVKTAPKNGKKSINMVDAY